MPAETTPADERDDRDTATIRTETELEVEREAIRMINQNVGVHRTVGDSDFDYAAVAKNPDSEDNPDWITFGYHEDELPAPF